MLGMNEQWTQTVTIMMSGTSMFVTTTWILANKISMVRLAVSDLRAEIVDRLGKAEARLDSLERNHELLMKLMLTTKGGDE